MGRTKKVKETVEGEVDPKQKALNELNERLNAKYGKGSVISGSHFTYDKTGTSTGSIAFDRATHCKGFPKGKIVEMFGPESCGKSTLSLHVIAEHQQKGGVCIYADFEHSFDETYAKQIGVDTDALIIMQPETMEKGYNMIDEYISSGLIRLIVIDSHTAMVAKVRLEGQIGESKIAPEARINSEALRKIKSSLDKYGVTLVGISQLRSDIGSMHGGDKPTGGNAWKFYSDMRIKIYKTLDKDKETNKTFVEIVKNKCGKPFGKCEVPIAWGIGIDKYKEVVELASVAGIIDKSGSWYSYKGDKIGQGASSVIQLLQDNDELYNEIREKLINAEEEALPIEKLTEAEIQSIEEEERIAKENDSIEEEALEEEAVEPAGISPEDY